MRHELGPVVEPDEGWCAPSEGQAVEGGDDEVGVDGALDDDGEAPQRLYSSITFKSFTILPSDVWSDWSRAR